MFLHFEKDDYVIKLVATKVTHFEGDPAAQSTKVYVKGREQPVIIPFNFKEVEKQLKEQASKS